MAQGTKFDKEKVLESLKEYFVLGYNRNKACMHAKFDPSLLKKWENQDPNLSIKIDAWIGQIGAMARKVWKDQIDAGSYTASKDWLERIEKDDFSTKVENNNLTTQLNVDIPLTEDEQKLIKSALIETASEKGVSEE